eukprot:4902902-Pyramimonas_sp.AAC.1
MGMICARGLPGGRWPRRGSRRPRGSGNVAERAPQSAWARQRRGRATCTRPTGAGVESGPGVERRRGDMVMMQH